MDVVARIDLVSLGQALRTAGRHPDLVKAIDRAAAIGSIRDDLRSAQAALKMIVSLQDASEARPAADREQESMLTGALFTQAVISYWRATETDGDRPKLLGETKLTAKQKATHKEAHDFRNGVIAHFGRGQNLPDGPLVREAVILSLFRHGPRRKTQVGVYTTRAQHKVAFASRLGALIDLRLEQVAVRIQPLFDGVMSALDAAGKIDPDLGKLLKDHPFDVDTFCASGEAADGMRAQLAAGAMDDMVFAVPVPRP